MQPHWINESKTCSIWFTSGKWIVGYISDLDKNIGVVIGPKYEVDWPQNISSGWEYAYATGTWVDAGADVIFEAKSTCKLTKVNNKTVISFTK